MNPRQTSDACLTKEIIMSETLKTLLLKKEFPLKNGKLGVLFSTQKALAEAIVDSDDTHYDNLPSVRTLLSSAFRENDPQPLPGSLANDILELSKKQLKDDQKVMKEFEEALLTSLSQIENEKMSYHLMYRDYIRDGKYTMVFSKNPPPLIYKFNSEARYFMERMSANLLADISVLPDCTYHFFVPSEKTGELVWQAIEAYFSQNKSLALYGVINHLLDLNNYNKIKISVLEEEKLFMPLTFIAHKTKSFRDKAFFTSYQEKEGLIVAPLGNSEIKSFYSILGVDINNSLSIDKIGTPLLYGALYSKRKNSRFSMAYLQTQYSTKLEPVNSYKVVGFATNQSVKPPKRVLGKDKITKKK